MHVWLRESRGQALRHWHLGYHGEWFIDIYQEWIDQRQQDDRWSIKCQIKAGNQLESWFFSGWVWQEKNELPYCASQKQNPTTLLKKNKKQLSSLKENSLKRFTIQAHSSVSISWPPTAKEHPTNDKTTLPKLQTIFFFKKKNKNAKPLGMCKYINSATKQKEGLIWKCGLSSNSLNVSFYFLLQFSPLMIKGWTSPPGSSAETVPVLFQAYTTHTHSHPAGIATRNTAK